MALLEPTLAPEAEPQPLASRVRRCSYRRMSMVNRRGERTYDVECLFPDRALPIPLGDLESAAPVCNSCTAAGIFRADET